MTMILALLATAFSATWASIEEVDALTDEVRVVAALPADGPDYPIPPLLILRCVGTRLDSFIAWHAYLGRGPTRVTYRIDGGVPRVESWGNSTDDTKTFAPDSFPAALTSASSLVVGVSPYRTSPVVKTWTWTGGLPSMGACDVTPSPPPASTLEDVYSGIKEMSGD